VARTASCARPTSIAPTQDTLLVTFPAALFEGVVRKYFKLSPCLILKDYFKDAHNRQVRLDSDSGSSGGGGLASDPGSLSGGSGVADSRTVGGVWV
jgi:hypothetical protein